MITERHFVESKIFISLVILFIVHASYDQNTNTITILSRLAKAIAQGVQSNI